MLPSLLPSFITWLSLSISHLYAVDHFFLLTVLFGINFKKKMLSGKMAEKSLSNKCHKKQNKEPARKIEIGHNWPIRYNWFAGSKNKLTVNYFESGNVSIDYSQGRQKYLNNTESRMGGRGSLNCLAIHSFKYRAFLPFVISRKGWPLQRRSVNNRVRSLDL